jgi:hypothetical protein
MGSSLRLRGGYQRAIKERLERAGIEVPGVTDHHFIQSIYFFDPNGLRLEVTTKTEKEEYINNAKQKARASLSEWTAKIARVNTAAA